jgi:hypothetical protein
MYGPKDTDADNDSSVHGEWRGKPVDGGEGDERK